MLFSRPRDTVKIQKFGFCKFIFHCRAARGMLVDNQPPGTPVPAIFGYIVPQKYAPRFKRNRFSRAVECVGPRTTTTESRVLHHPSPFHVHKIPNPNILHLQATIQKNRVASKSKCFAFPLGRLSVPSTQIGGLDRPLTTLVRDSKRTCVYFPSLTKTNSIGGLNRHLRERRHARKEKSGIWTSDVERVECKRKVRVLIFMVAATLPPVSGNRAVLTGTTHI